MEPEPEPEPYLIEGGAEQGPPVGGPAEVTDQLPVPLQARHLAVRVGALPQPQGAVEPCGGHQAVAGRELGHVHSRRVARLDPGKQSRQERGRGTEAKRGGGEDSGREAKGDTGRRNGRCASLSVHRAISFRRVCCRVLFCGH